MPAVVVVVVAAAAAVAVASGAYLLYDRLPWS